MKTRDGEGIGKGGRKGIVIKFRAVGRRFQVESPYNQEFILAAHQMEGRWRRRSRVWSFPRASYLKVTLAVCRIYGVESQDIIRVREVSI